MNTVENNGTDAAPILQVEDDDNDVVLLRYAFSSAGLDRPVQAVSDGQQAIEYLAGEGKFANRQEYPLPCMVLLDIKLPRRGGLEVLQWIRSQPALKAVVVIMFSASSYPEEINRAYELGANSFLTKPAGAEELTRLVSVIHTYWFQHNQFSDPVW